MPPSEPIHRLPVPATYVITQDRRIAFAHVDVNYVTNRYPTALFVNLSDGRDAACGHVIRKGHA